MFHIERKFVKFFNWTWIEICSSCQPLPPPRGYHCGCKMKRRSFESPEESIDPLAAAPHQKDLIPLAQQMWSSSSSSSAVTCGAKRRRQEGKRRQSMRRRRWKKNVAMQKVSVAGVQRRVDSSSIVCLSSVTAVTRRGGGGGEEKRAVFSPVFFGALSLLSPSFLASPRVNETPIYAGKNRKKGFRDIGSHYWWSDLAYERPGARRRRPNLKSLRVRKLICERLSPVAQTMAIQYWHLTKGSGLIE